MHNSKKGIVELIECQLIFSPTTLILIIALGWAIGISINVIDLWLALTVTLIISYIINKRLLHAGNKNLCLASLIFLGLCTLSTLIAMQFIAIGWDGSAYHQPTILFLNFGWNPFH